MRAHNLDDAIMADVTYYVALPFVAGDDGPEPREAVECTSASAAVMRAERLARTEGRECSKIDTRVKGLGCVEGTLETSRLLDPVRANKCRWHQHAKRQIPPGALHRRHALRGLCEMPAIQCEPPCEHSFVALAFDLASEQSIAFASSCDIWIAQCVSNRF